MKKLMVAIAAVASAFGLYAADLETGTSFEPLTPGAFDKELSDIGTRQKTKWFSTEKEVDGTVSNYADGEAYQGDRPGMFVFDESTQTNYLALETSQPLYRGASDKATEATTVDEAFIPQDIGSGFYVDQLVKFMAPSDSETTVDLAGGKIAIWLQEVEGDDNATATNLVITAGFFDTATHTVQTNYLAKYDAAALVGNWHRITIKAIGATTDDIAGFVVYIDGVAVATDGAIAADGVEPAFTTLAGKYKEPGQLFPSAVSSGGYSMSIAAVGFKGSGAIDDVSLTTVVPPFAKDDITFDLDWEPTEIAAITAGDKTLTPAELAEGSIQLALPGDATSLTIVATPETGYSVSLSSEDCEVDGMTFKFNGPASGSIVTSFNYFEVNGVGYSTFTEALTAANAGDTITLNGDCTIDPMTIPETGILVDKEITLDLAGNDLLVNDEMALFEVGAAFTIVNSGDVDAKIGIEDVEEANVFSIVEGGSVTIGTEENQTNFVVVEGLASDGDDPTIYQGKFLASLNTEEGDMFMWIAGVPDEGEGDYKATLGGSYWTVQKEGEEPTGVIKIVGGESYETIDEALAAAQDNDTLQLLKDVELTATVAITKAITFDLNRKTVTFADGTYGDGAFQVTADATIKNGTIADGLTALVAACCINIVDANGTLQNLVVDTTHFKWGVGGEGSDWQNNEPTYTITCANVDVTGGRSLFVAEGINMTLDKNCSATQSGEDTEDWRNCAIHAGANAVVTIAGGKYEGKYAIYKMSSPAKIYVNGGDFTGDVYMHEIEKAYEGTGEDVLAITAGNFSDDEIDVKYLANEVQQGYKRAWVEGDYEDYVKPGAEPIKYKVIYAAGNGTALNVYIGFKRIDSGTEVSAGTEIQIATIPKSGYGNEKTYVNGAEVTGESYTVESDVEITSSATLIEYEITYKFQGVDEEDEEKIVNPNTRTTYTVEDETIVFEYATCAGYIFRGWAPAEIDAGSTGNKMIIGEFEKVSAEYPDDWPATDDTTKAKFATWFATKGADADLSTDDAKDAFLLNCTVDELEDAKDAFKITSIKFVEGEWVIGEPEGDFNGEVVMKAFEEAGCKTEVTEPTGEETELFWKAFLVFPAPPEPATEPEPVNED